MTSFILSQQPWIPCTRLDGKTEELSTRDCLLRAHELRGIADASPLVTAALHRHLLAVVHASYAGPRSMKEWTAIAKAGAFDPKCVEGYLDRVADRLDLFHPERPFAQTPGLKSVFPDFVDGIESLELEGSSFGSAANVFAHARSVEPFSPGRAARSLLAHHAFATGGLVRKPKEPTSATATPLCGAAVVLLRRETLFLTLVANMLIVNPDASQPVAASAQDVPSWETDGLPRKLTSDKEPKVVPTGWLQMLTWLSRRILLVHDGQRVSGWIRAVGVGLAEGAPKDPMVVYREQEKRGLVAVAIDADRAFWRDAGALFDHAGQGKGVHRPRAFDLVAHPEAALALGGPAARYRIDVLGLAADKSKVNTSRSERLETSARLLADPDVREEVEHAISVSEAVVAALRSSLRRYARFALSSGDRDPDWKDINALADSMAAEPSAWSALGMAFESFISGLEGDRAAARRDFEREAHAIARKRFELAVAGAGETGGALQAIAYGERSLLKGLAAVPWTKDTTGPAPEPMNGAPL